MQQKGTIHQIEVQVIGAGGGGANASGTTGSGTTGGAGGAGISSSISGSSVTYGGGGGGGGDDELEIGHARLEGGDELGADVDLADADGVEPDAFSHRRVFAMKIAETVGPAFAVPLVSYHPVDGYGAYNYDSQQV